MSIKKTCEEILVILKKVDNKSWQKVFEKFIQDFENIEKGILKREIRIIYKGMGSFNDLVLSKDGIISIEENIELDELRKELSKKIMI